MKTRILPVMLVVLLGVTGVARAQVAEAPPPQIVPNGGLPPANVVPAGATVPNGGCNGCASCGTDGCWPNRHGNCVEHFFNWLCYRPLPLPPCACRHTCSCYCTVPNYYYFLPPSAFMGPNWLAPCCGANCQTCQH